MEDALSLLRLECSELELPGWIVANRHIHPGVASIAGAVEESQPLVLGPFMHRGIKLVIHRTPRIGPDRLGYAWTRNSTTRLNRR